jgi:hypothetical protein
LGWNQRGFGSDARQQDPRHKTEEQAEEALLLEFEKAGGKS